MHNTIIAALRAKALSLIPNSADYAQAVLSGAQLWSGADLKGKARSYWRSYETQRIAAQKALMSAGGIVLPCEKGKRLTAKLVCTDDFGNSVAATENGFAWPHTASQYKHK